MTWRASNGRKGSAEAAVKDLEKVVRAKPEWIKPHVELAALVLPPQAAGGWRERKANRRPAGRGTPAAVKLRAKPQLRGLPNLEHPVAGDVAQRLDDARRPANFDLFGLVLRRPVRNAPGRGWRKRNHAGGHVIVLGARLGHHFDHAPRCRRGCSLSPPARCPASARRPRCGSSRSPLPSRAPWPPRPPGRLRRSRANAQPRWRAGGQASSPASSVSACHLPLAPRLRKTVLCWSTALPGYRQRPHMAARHEQVLPPIVVKVVEARAVARHGTAQLSHPARIRDLLKPPPAQVPKDRERLVVQGHGHNIGVAVIIEIPEIQAHAGDEFPVLD